MTRPRLIIADDHRMLVDSLSTALCREYTIAGVAFDGPSLLVLLEHCRADCLLLDVVLEGRNGLELIPRIRALQPSMNILVVTMLLDRSLADLALHSGANGFVPKDAGIDELKYAVSELLVGHSYVSPRLPKTTHRVGMRAKHPALLCLTPREEEIFLLLGEGKSETQIAGQLGVSPSTITFHKQHLMRALGIETDAFLMRYAVVIRTGVEQPEPRAGS